VVKIAIGEVLGRPLRAGSMRHFELHLIVDSSDYLRICTSTESFTTYKRHLGTPAQGQIRKKYSLQFHYGITGRTS
jgi:hypothetical protein